MFPKLFLTDPWFGEGSMGSMTWVSTIFAVLFLLMLVAPPCAAEQQFLEIYAGDDKVIKVGELLGFTDARIVSPAPLDPDLSYSFRWDFDDSVDVNLDSDTTNDGESHERATSWRYHIMGRYTVTLSVSDGTRNARDTLAITVVDNYPPVIVTEVDVTAPIGKPYLLNVTASDRDHDTSDLKWEWQFGDGTMSRSSGPYNHTYEELGTHLVTVKVLDPENAMTQTTISVMVVDDTPPIARAGPDTRIKLNGTVQFDGSASSDNVGVVSLTWTFEYRNDTVSLTGRTPIFKYEEAGTYVIGLKVSDERGNWDIDTIMVNVASDGKGDGTSGGLEGTGFFVDNHLSVDLAGYVVITLAFAVSAILTATLSFWHESEWDFKIFFRDVALGRSR